ncbi:hypothetical protein [Halorussus litoreus]|uniref:hypothetical protein n=1 Tax=Halorussus litoreus TaxID=1710536 RepID=UPI000E2273C3|nr:hypothetical protein [Halorussus litoreus]
MARDLRKARDSSVGTDGDPADTGGDSRGPTTVDLASELAADAYNIVVALAILTASYWLAFRDLPVELFTLGLVTLGLVALNVAVALRYRAT